MEAEMMKLPVSYTHLDVYKRQGHRFKSYSRNSNFNIVFAQLAQLVEQRTENPRVSGSIPELGIQRKYGILAQLVEHLTFNQVVRGSNPRCLTI